MALPEQCSKGSSSSLIAGPVMRPPPNVVMVLLITIYRTLKPSTWFCSGLIEFDTFIRENEHTNRGAFDREKTWVQTIPRRV